jgi:predicted GNAT family acetyltransferase
MGEIKITHLNPNSQKTEAWIALIEGEVVGHIYMEKEVGNKIKFLDAWVHDNHRRKGIFRMLWDTRWNYVSEMYSGYLVYAWCKENSLHLLKEKGFDTGEICTYVQKVI